MGTRLDWFKFYPSDFLNSPTVMMMSPAARGCYITLLSRCWLNAKNGGGIPNKIDYILSVCNCSEKEWNQVKDAVLSRFDKKDGQLLNPRLLEEITEVKELSDTKAQNAQSGWETRRIASAMHPHSNGTNLQTYIDKDRDVDTDKESDKKGDFRNIRIRYRSFFKVSHSNAKQFRESYYKACGQFGEKEVLDRFDEWAEANMWRKDSLRNTGLRFFLADLPDLVDEAAASKQITEQREGPKEDLTGIQEQIEQNRVLAPEVAARIKEIEQDKIAEQSLKVNPLVF